MMRIRVACAVTAELSKNIYSSPFTHTNDPEPQNLTHYKNIFSEDKKDRIDCA